MIISMLGWFGSILYLINHGYISVYKNWKTHIYYSGNCIAALSLMVSSFMLLSYQAVVVNGFWALISMLLLLNVNVAKVPMSKRIFYVGFISFVTISLIIGFHYGWAAPVFHVYIGWSSSYVFCLSYFLFCSKKINQISYLMLNFYAAIALLPILYSQENWPVFTLEVCWAAISIYGVYRRIEQIHLID